MEKRVYYRKGRTREEQSGEEKWGRVEQKNGKIREET